MHAKASTSVGVRELSRHNFDLLPALYRDAGTDVRWVLVGARDEPLARLAELLGFPVIESPGEGPAAENLERVDCMLVRSVAPQVRRALGEQGIRWSEVLDSKQRPAAELRLESEGG